MAEIGQVPRVPLGRHHALGSALLAGALALCSLTVALTDDGGLYALVGVLFVLCFLPLFLSWRRGTVDVFEPLHLTGLLSFVQFGLAAIWSVNDPRVAYDTHLVPYIPIALFYCVLGYGALVTGYYLPWGHRRRRPPVSELEPVGVLFLAIPGVLGFVAYAAAQFATTSGRLGFGVAPALHSISQLAPLFLMAWALAWMLLFSGRATGAQKWLLFLFLIPAAAFIARSLLGNKTVTITLAGLPIAAYWYTKHRIPWKTVLVLLLLVVFVIFPFYNTFRLSDLRLAQSERVSLTMDRIVKWDSEDYLRSSIRLFKRRMAMINSTAVVVRDVGRWVPYAHGSTIFEPLVVNFIPRFLWPEKPIYEMGYGFGETFRVTNPTDRYTRIAATLPGELYWNFALPGVLIGMFLWGWFLRFVYRRFGEMATLDPVRRSIYLSLVVALVFVGSVAPAVVGIVRTLLVLFALCWFSQRLGILRVAGARAGRMRSG